MNDAADEPMKASPQEPELRKLSDEQLQSILEGHKRWVEEGGKFDQEHLRARLHQADQLG